MRENNLYLSYMSNLNITTLNEHIYRGERRNECSQAALGFKWTTTGRKEPKSKQSTIGESDWLLFAFSAQPPTLNSYNFYNSFLN